MSEWECRQGVILTEICGVHLLVADRKAMKKCAFVRPVNEIGAFIWELLSEGKCVGDILSQLREEYDIPPTYDLEKDVERFLGDLSEGHYIENVTGNLEDSSVNNGGDVS